MYADLKAFAKSWLMQSRCGPRAGTMPITGRTYRVAVYPPVFHDDFYMTMQRPWVEGGSEFMAEFEAACQELGIRRSGFARRRPARRRRRPAG
mgnify:CR=1 FL=1